MNQQFRVIQYVADIGNHLYKVFIRAVYVDICATTGDEVILECCVIHTSSYRLQKTIVCGEEDIRRT